MARCELCQVRRPDLIPSYVMGNTPREADDPEKLGTCIISSLGYLRNVS